MPRNPHLRQKKSTTQSLLMNKKNLLAHHFQLLSGCLALLLSCQSLLSPFVINGECVAVFEPNINASPFSGTHRGSRSYRAVGNYLSLSTEHCLARQCTQQHVQCLTAQIFPCQTGVVLDATGQVMLVPVLKKTKLLAATVLLLFIQGYGLQVGYWTSVSRTWQILLPLSIWGWNIIYITVTAFRSLNC